MKDLESRIFAVAADGQALPDVSFCSGHTPCPTLYLSVHGCWVAGTYAGISSCFLSSKLKQW